jgi:hypothetical protein
MNDMPGTEQPKETGETSGMSETPPQPQNLEGAESGEMAYCVKCRKKTSMVETQKVTMKNGRPAVKGKCSVCGTGMYKILSQKA